MAEAFVVRCDDSEQVLIERADTPDSCKCMSRQQLSQSGVLRDLLSSLVESGEDSVVSYAPAGLLPIFLDLLCGQQSIDTMEAESLIAALKASDFFAHEPVILKLCAALHEALLEPTNKTAAFNTDSLYTSRASLILNSLPDHLAVTVLQVSLTSLRFAALITSLPEPHHPLLLHARFPEIDSKNEMKIDSHVNDLTIIPVLRAATAIQGLKALVFSVSKRTLEHLDWLNYTCLIEELSNTLKHLCHLTRLELGTTEGESFLATKATTTVAVLLPGMSKLRDLALHGSSELRREGSKPLLQVLQRCTGLERLTLTSVAIVPLSVKGSGGASTHHLNTNEQPSASISAADNGSWLFGEALVCLTGLQSLSLHSCPCDEHSLMPIQEVFSQHPNACILGNLTNLSLRPESILAHLSRERSRDHTKHLAAIIHRMTALKSISMKSTGGAVAALASVMQDLHQLSHIHVCDSIGWDDLSCLGAAMKYLPHFEHIDFGGLCRYEPAYRLSRFVCHESINMMADAVSMFSRLQFLSLSQCPLATCSQESGALAIAEGLGRHSNLQTFAMDFSNCSYGVMSTLGLSLRGHIRLQHLDLHAKYDEPKPGPRAPLPEDEVAETVEEKLTSATVHFMHHLSALCSLTGLRFSVRRAYLGASRVATVSIATSLPSLSKLESLNLSELRVSDIACEAMATGVSKLTGLKSLSLIGNSMLSQDLMVLGPAMKALPLLSHLDLSQNRYRDAGALALAQELPEMLQLRVLKLSDSGVTPRGVAGVVDALVHHPYVQEPICPMRN